jgi:hypothetical protein
MKKSIVLVRIIICLYRERERQDKVYGAAFYAIEHFVEQQGEENEYKQRLHWTKPVKRVSRSRKNILQSYFQDLERCYQGARESCKKVSDDMNLAIQAYTMSR